jgi:hypothetical protein
MTTLTSLHHTHDAAAFESDQAENRRRLSMFEPGARRVNRGVKAAARRTRKSPPAPQPGDPSLVRLGDRHGRWERLSGDRNATRQFSSNSLGPGDHNCKVLREGYRRLRTFREFVPVARTDNRFV